MLPTGLENEKEMEKTPPPKSQNAEAVGFYIQQLDNARDQRTQTRPEFDDMSYEQDYFANQTTAHSYLRKKKNDDEVRVNTGTAEKKIELILNELMAMNFQAEIRAYDEDDLEVDKLGQDMSDILKRTNEIERDEDMYADAFLELLTQRALFIEETYGPLPTTTLRTGKTGKFRSHDHAQKRLLSGLQVFLGDISIPAYRFQEQPYIVLYDRVLYEEAKRLYGDNPEFKYVRAGMPLTDNYGLWFKYRLGNLTSREVEIIRYYSAADNEYQVILNGVMMEKPKTPLPYKHGGYRVSMTVVKSISRFLSYGKQPLASAKYLAGLSDETIRNLIRKMRQAIEPPIGVPTGRVYSKDIYSPGAVTQGISKDSLSRLIDHDGVTQSEFQMFQLIKEAIDEFVGPYGAANNPGDKAITATQIMEQQKQSLKMLGLAMLAAMRAKRDMTYLRLDNIFENYFKPIGKTLEENGEMADKYRSFSVEPTKLGSDGTMGKKVLRMMDRDLSDEEQEDVLKFEDAMESEGKPFRYRTLNVKKLENIPVYYYIVVTSHERESGAMDRVLFQDEVAQAMNISQITGRQINADKLLDNFERTWKSKGLFERAAPGMGMMNGGDTRSQAQSLLGDIDKMQGEQQPPGPEMMQGSPQGQQIIPKSPALQPGAKSLVKA